MSAAQLDLLEDAAARLAAEIARAREQRDEGIRRAISHAETELPGWGDRAYRILLDYLRRYTPAQFMVEDVRRWAQEQIEDPPSLRSWGAVTLRAARAGLIVKIGYANVKDPNGHRGCATLWGLQPVNAPPAAP